LRDKNPARPFGDGIQWTTFPPCGVERESEGRPYDAVAVTDCVNASNRLQVCEHVAPGDDFDIAIELRNSGRLVHTWYAEVPGAHQGFPFHVVRGDLTGDGIDDIAVITLVASSNGRVINTDVVCAADGSNLEKDTECVDLQDSGKVGYFTREPGARGCLLLQTSFTITNSPPKTGGQLRTVTGWGRIPFGVSSRASDNTVA
jgi:hypothetical protein